MMNNSHFNLETVFFYDFKEKKYSNTKFVHLVVGGLIDMQFYISNILKKKYE